MNLDNYFYEIGLDFGTKSQNVNIQCYVVYIFVHFGTHKRRFSLHIKRDSQFNPKNSGYQISKIHPSFTVLPFHNDFVFLSLLKHEQIASEPRKLSWTFKVCFHAIVNQVLWVLLQQKIIFSLTFWHEQRRDFNANRAAVSRIKRKFFTQMYPIQLVNPDGSTVRIRYDVPKKYVKVNWLGANFL